MSHLEVQGKELETFSYMLRPLANIYKISGALASKNMCCEYLKKNFFFNVRSQSLILSEFLKALR